MLLLVSLKFKQINLMKNLLLSLFCLLFVNSLFAQEFDGYALYNDNNTTFLIDKDGDIAHRWNCDERGGYAMLLMEDGNLMRAAQYNSNVLTGAAIAGMVQVLDKDANVVWEFVYSNADHVTHHDITLMPNGGVLLTAWEVKSIDELQDLGFTGTTEKWPTQFIEVQPDGNGGGEIVWEWHFIDHVIQDVDPNKPNYGVVADNPQLLDINLLTTGGGPGSRGGDWFHVNGVDYNEELDLITFTSRYLSEVFIIDHSTTTAEAASHSGGNSGMGGDLMYRWGNPSNYDTPGPQLIAGPVHDSRWIPEDGRFRAGMIQFFSNEGIDGRNSLVQAIMPPFNGTSFDRTPGEPYGPVAANFTHDCRDNANGQSASDAMPNGNTYVNLSRGYMYEVDKDDNLVWQYAEGPTKSFRFTCDHPGVKILLGADACETPSGTNDFLVEKNLLMSPNPSTGLFNIDGLSGENILQNIEVMDVSGKRILIQKDQFKTVDLNGKAPGVYFAKFNFEGGRSQTKLLTLK